MRFGQTYPGTAQRYTDPKGFMTENSTPKDGTSNPKTALTLPKKRKLRIGEAEIRGMGELLAQRLTETEACGVLGLAPRSWFRWKQRQRNGGRFAALLEAITGQKIAAHIANIEAGAVGAGPHKRADWRASKAVLEIVAPTRYGTQQPQATAPPIALPAGQLTAWLVAAYSPPPDKPTGAVVDTTATPIQDTWSDVVFPPGQPERKQLPAPAEPHTRKGTHGSDAE